MAKPTQKVGFFCPLLPRIEFLKNPQTTNYFPYSLTFQSPGILKVKTLQKSTEIFPVKRI